MALHEDIKAQQRLLSEHRRTLMIYLEQLAQLGSNYAPPGTINGAYEACHHIRRIKAILANWGVTTDMQAGEELCEHADLQEFVRALHGRQVQITNSQVIVGGKGFGLGNRVRIKSWAGKIRMEDPTVQTTISASVGHTGTVVGQVGSLLRIEWDKQEWTTVIFRKKIHLDKFTSNIKPEFLDKVNENG